MDRASAVDPKSDGSQRAVMADRIGGAFRGGGRQGGGDNNGGGDKWRRRRGGGGFGGEPSPKPMLCKRPSRAKPPILK